MLRQVERNLEQDDVQVCANRYGAFIDANHENILLMKINRNYQSQIDLIEICSIEI